MPAEQRQIGGPGCSSKRLLTRNSLVLGIRSTVVHTASSRCFLGGRQSRSLVDVRTDQLDGKRQGGPGTSENKQQVRARKGGPLSTDSGTLWTYGVHRQHSDGDCKEQQRSGLHDAERIAMCCRRLTSRTSAKAATAMDN